MKICKKCKLSKNEIDYSRRKDAKDGLQYWCKPCMSSQTLEGLLTKPLYKTWLSMRSRCNTPTAHAYEHYGGRGITICKEWDSYARYEKDILKHCGTKPGPGHTLDRIDNDGNYEPINMRWATQKTQIANRRPKYKKKVK